MYNITPSYRAQTLAYSYKRVQVTNVDPSTGIVDVRDSANQKLQVTFQFFHSPYVQVPAISEYWLITRLDNNWVLHSKFEDPNETHPLSNLSGGDVRISSPASVYIDASRELICDFNKAAPSFAKLNANTFPGSALYGSATLDQVNAGTVVVTERLVTTFNSFLPSRNVVHGQETDVLYQAGNEGYVNWRFKYNANGTLDPWQFAGGPGYLNFNSGSVILTGTATTWNGTETPFITVPFTGEYILSGGAEARSAANNTGFKIGLSLNDADPGQAILAGYITEAGLSQSVNTTYQIRLTKGQTLRIWYAKELPTKTDAVTFFNRWMQITPIRVQADPLDDPEPVIPYIYEGAG